ncbi:MAG: 2-oxo-4-hydroxy-4-carboxy-5-ureidoimidazoline decarboxylase [Pseudomonadota bacterium]
MSISLAQLNELSANEFVTQLADIFEHSPWVAEGVSDARPFESVETLHKLMVGVVDGAGVDRQLALIRAHPDLAGKAALAGELTDSSTSEQAGAGLDRLSEEGYARFHTLNNAYKSRFDFPFILAVKGHDKHSILAAFEERLNNEVDAERVESLRQIARIAQFRLEALIA